MNVLKAILIVLGLIFVIAYPFSKAIQVIPEVKLEVSKVILDGIY